jgi:hypothetical protein
MIHDTIASLLHKKAKTLTATTVYCSHSQVMIYIRTPCAQQHFSFQESTLHYEDTLQQDVTL